MNLIQHILHAYLHGVFYQPTNSDGTSASFSSAYDIIMIIGGVVLTAGCVAWGFEADGFWGVMRRLPIPLSLTVWPYALLVLVVVVVLAGPVLIGWSYIKLLPDKETRIMRKEEKIANLRGDVATLRRNA